MREQQRARLEWFCKLAAAPAMSCGCSGRGGKVGSLRGGQRGGGRLGSAEVALFEAAMCSAVRAVVGGCNTAGAVVAVPC